MVVIWSRPSAIPLRWPLCADATAIVAGQLLKEVLEALAATGTDQNPAPTVDGGSPRVERRHAGRGGDGGTRIAVEPVALLECFPRPRRAGQKHVLSGVGEGMEAIFGGEGWW